MRRGEKKKEAKEADVERKSGRLGMYRKMRGKSGQGKAMGEQPRWRERK
jgi:hypothetical protein